MIRRRGERMQSDRYRETAGRPVDSRMKRDGNPTAMVSAHNGGEADMSLPAALRALFGYLSPARRRAFVPLIALMLAGAVAEVATLGTLLPFLAAVADSSNSPFVVRFAPLLDLFGTGDAVLLLTGLFGFVALVSAALRLALLWTSSAFVNGIAYELAVRLYDNALNESYVAHTRRNSSEAIAAINKVEILAWNVLNPLTNGAVALVIAGFIIAGLIAIDPGVALAAGIGFTAVYLVATAATRSRLRRNSIIIADAQDRRVKSMQEGLGGIRDVLIDQSQPVFLESYERAMAGLRDARTRNIFLSGAPRFVVEALGMIMIAAVAVVVAGRPGGLVAAIPILGALALGAQRLLPLIQQIYAGWAQTMGNRQVLLDVLELLPAPAPAVPAKAALPFASAIRLDDVAYAYPGGRGPALQGISLDIPKGARVGIAGRTGSGKSTLMDLVLGLLEPLEGAIFVDGVRLSAENRAAWQMNIAHVPQAIFLADATVAENIAFGIRKKDIDRERMRRAAEQAELAEVIEALPEGYDTRVGERGIQLSGGQRQRVGIARALYKQASVLVFDEATSALDTETESAVMAAIERLDRDLTILIIAHRLSTLEGCDMVVRLEEGRARVTPSRLKNERREAVR